MQSESQADKYVIATFNVCSVMTDSALGKVVARNGLSIHTFINSSIITVSC